jgi:hypothetical protein
MTRRSWARTSALLLLLGASTGHVAAQGRSTDTALLRAEIERRFDVLPLRDGVALRPKDDGRGFRSVEVTGGPIAIDGQPATGAEIRSRLGRDADLVLELSYLSDEARRTLFAVDQGAPVERRQPQRGERRGRGTRQGDRVRVGGSVTVEQGEVVDGDVVAVGGSARVDGEVRGDVVAVGGSVVLGPEASVDNNVVVVGGTLRRDPAARIGGRVQEVGIGAFDLGNWGWRTNPLSTYWGSMVGSIFALVGTLTRLAILCLLASLVLLLGRRYAERAGDRAAFQPFKSGAIGFLAQVLFLPVLIITIVVLVMTIVGIPLLLLIPFLILGLALVGLVGFTGVAHHVGALLRARSGWSNDNPYLTTIAGIVVLLSPALLARLISLGGGVLFPVTFGLGLLGALVEYIAWTVGFGAVALARFNPIPSVTVEAAGPIGQG